MLAVMAQRLEPSRESTLPDPHVKVSLHLGAMFTTSTTDVVDS
jgi:hypothetical protein